MSWLTQVALTQRLLIMLLALLLGVLGWRAMRSIPIDAFPDVSAIQVKIIIKAPGMTPEEVGSRITAPIEVEMLGIPQQTMLRSISKYALADITVDFSEETDIYWARQQIAERLSGIMVDLPADISGGMAPITTPLGETFMFTIEGGGLSLAERRTLLDWVIRPALRSVPGVADVNALGGFVKTFEIVPDNAALYAQGLTIDHLIEVIGANNRNDGAGRLTDGEEILLVRARGSIQSLEDLGSIVVKSHKVEPVYVRDVAILRFGSLTRYGGVTKDGKSEAVEGLVLGLRGANAQRLVEGVKAKLAALQPTLPTGVTIQVFYDRGKLISRAVGTVSRALAEAVILVLVLLVLMLGHWRAALTVALVLPLSALATFYLMVELNMTANLMSLGGLAIAIGMLVDAAVVVENIVSHLAREKPDHQVPRLHLIYRAVAEVIVPVSTGILVIMVVFLPLLSLQGLEGKLFSPVAITIMLALGSSLILSLTVIPVIASFLLGHVSSGEPLPVKIMHALYTPILKWSLRHPPQDLRHVAGGATAGRGSLLNLR